MEKVEKIIKIKDKEVVKLSSLSNDPTVENFKKQIKQELFELKKLYRTDFPEIKIELIYSRKEFNNKLGRKTQEWFIGNTSGEKIYIFSPKAVKKHSTHNKKKLDKVIKHEICHVFNTKVNKNIPILIDEGISLYLAGQKKDNNFKKSDISFFANNLEKEVTFNSFLKHNGYKIAYCVTKNFVKKNDKRALKRLLKKPSLIKKEGFLR